MRSCEEQLTEVRKKYHDKYSTFTNNEKLLSDHPFLKGTYLIVGDLILAGIDKMYDYMKPLLWKLPNYIILHVGTNDAVSNISREILDKILKLKTYMQKELPKCQITISTPIKPHNHGKHH